MTYSGCIVELVSICRELGPEYWYSDPIDGQGIVYGITATPDDREPRPYALHTVYRYAITWESWEDDESAGR